MTAAQFIPRVHTERCTRYRYRYSECDRCAEMCPYEAVRLTEEGASIDAENCRHCGLCLASCPTETFQSEALPRAGLVRAAIEAGRYSIACAPSGVIGDATVPCLGALDAVTAAFILSRGTDLVLAGGGHCAQCAHGEKAGPALELLWSGVEHLQAARGDEKWGHLAAAGGDGQGIDHLGASRRHFFRRLVAGGAARFAEAGSETPAIPAKAVRAAPHYRPLARELTEAVLADKAIAVHPALFAATVEREGECTGCGLCERVCPMGALRSSEEGGAWQLLFRGRQCVGCGVCVESCQPGVLRLAEEIAVQPREGVRIAAVRRTRCERCGRVYVPSCAEDSCPVCNDDEANFAAIFG